MTGACLSVSERQVEYRVKCSHSVDILLPFSSVWTTAGVTYGEIIDLQRSHLILRYDVQSCNHNDDVWRLVKVCFSTRALYYVGEL